MGNIGVEDRMMISGFGTLLNGAKKSKTENKNQFTIRIILFDFLCLKPLTTRVLTFPSRIRIKPNKGTFLLGLWEKEEVINETS